ncbi:MAG: S1 family peptidase [Pseudomonadota bacterium]|jgi:S1-C subfamily serine protease
MFNKAIATLMLATTAALSLGCGSSDSEDQTLTLENVCGNERSQEQTSKIVGGRECNSPNGTVVKIILLDEEDNQTLCSGVRLNVTTVLTAAHCLNEFVFSISVELPSGERITPTKITIHPKAATLGSLFINDLALLTISPPAGEIPPPTVPIAESVKVGDTLTILGYGATTGENSTGSGVLRVGEMQVDEVTNDSILSDYTPTTPSNTCFGDSGGPAFVKVGNETLALAGITSTGTNVICAVGDRSAFTNLTNQALREFILKAAVTENEEGADTRKHPGY